MNGRNIKFKEEQPMDAFPAKVKATKALWQFAFWEVGVLSQEIKIMDVRRRIRLEAIEAICVCQSKRVRLAMILRTPTCTDRDIGN
jgi:hypothetical protein